MPTTRNVEVSGYAGYWTASCWCGWVGQTFRSSGPYNASDRARKDGSAHTCIK